MDCNVLPRPWEREGGAGGGRRDGHARVMCTRRQGKDAHSHHLIGEDCVDAVVKAAHHHPGSRGEDGRMAHTLSPSHQPGSR